MRKVKLLIVSPYFPPSTGGVQNYVYNISKGLMKDYSYEVVVITSNHQNSSEYKEEILDGMKVYRLPRQFKISNTPINFKWKKQIKKIIKTEKPNIINAHTPVPFIADVACKVAYKLNIPFVLTYHAGSLYKKGFSIFNVLIYLYKLIFEKKMFDKSSKILPVSDYVKIQFTDKIQKKSEIIYNAIKNSEIKKVNNSINFKKNILFLGSLNKAHDLKGLSQIINAIKVYINNVDNNIKLSILGDGDYKNHYQELVNNLGLEKHVLFYGAKFGKEKEKIINKSKIIITYPDGPYDAFPTVFLEAWANNLPIIAANIGCAPYLIKNKEDGFLVEPNNPKKLAEGIYKLLRDKHLQYRLIKNGNKKVRENFTWNISTKKMDEVIREILK